MSSLDSISVSRAMTSPVKTVQQNEVVQQACKVMIQNNIGCAIVVVAQSGNPQSPVGIITERDIVRHLAERPICFSDPVNQLMNKPVLTIHPNASLQVALQTMQARDIRRLLVMSDDGNNMAGIITDRDIFKFLARNESVSSGLLSEEVLAKNREMAERLHSGMLDDILHKKP